MELKEFAQKLATALGSDWSLVEDKDYSRHPNIQHKHGYSFWLQGPSYGHADSYAVHANWPIDAAGNRHYPSSWSKDYKDPTIYFGVKKSPEQGAKDVSRRFLPVFIPQWIEQKGLANADDNYRSNRQYVAEQAAAIVGGTVAPDNNGLARVRLPYRDNARISAIDFGSNHTIQLTATVTLDQLRTIHKLLAEGTEA